MKSYWLKAETTGEAGPGHRPRHLGEVMQKWTYNVSCSIPLPSPEIDVLYLKGSVYEIFAPCTMIRQNGSRALIWRGLYQARKIGQETEK